MAGPARAAAPIAGAPIGALPSLATASAIPSPFAQFGQAVGEYPQLAGQEQLQNSETAEQQAQLDDAQAKRLIELQAQNPTLTQTPAFQAQLQALARRRHMQVQPGQKLDAQMFAPKKMLSDLPREERAYVLTLPENERRAYLESAGYAMTPQDDHFLKLPPEMSEVSKRIEIEDFNKQIDKIANGQMTLPAWQAYLSTNRLRLQQAFGPDVDIDQMINNPDILKGLSQRTQLDIEKMGAYLGKTQAEIMAAKARAAVADSTVALNKIRGDFLGYKERQVDADIQNQTQRTADNHMRVMDNHAHTQALIEHLYTNPSGGSTRLIRGITEARNAYGQAMRNLASWDRIIQQDKENGLTPSDTEVDAWKQAKDDVQTAKDAVSSLGDDALKQYVQAATTSSVTGMPTRATDLSWLDSSPSQVWKDRQTGWSYKKIDGIRYYTDGPKRGQVAQ